jgi:hypothetical protein
VNDKEAGGEETSSSHTVKHTFHNCQKILFTLLVYKRFWNFDSARPNENLFSSKNLYIQACDCLYRKIAINKKKTCYWTTSKYFFFILKNLRFTGNESNHAKIFCHVHTMTIDCVRVKAFVVVIHFVILGSRAACCCCFYTLSGHGANLSFLA